jgi:hypothetical protein
MFQFRKRGQSALVVTCRILLEESTRKLRVFIALEASSNQNALKHQQCLAERAAILITRNWTKK